MTDIVAKWGDTTAITITLDDLADGAARQSAAITSHNGMGALVRPLLLGVTGNDGDVDVYVYAGLGTGNYAGGCTGSDAAYTYAEFTNLKKLMTISLNDASNMAAVENVASLFGGAMPERWGIVVHNVSGAALETVGNSISYQTVIATTV